MDDKDSEIDRADASTDFTGESSTWQLGGGDSENVYFFDRFSEFGWDLPTPPTGEQTCFQLNPIGSDPLAPNHSGSSRANLGGTQVFEAEAEFDVVEPSSARQGGPLSTSSSEDPEKSKASDGSSAAELQTSITACKNTKIKGQKRMRQPRFAFMTKSEVDHLEDGFRWRKYGQKAVKNSPFPRSYFRCTNSKCTVKKRVERSSEDPTVVITTYEGQHCHHSIGFLRGGLIAHEPPLFPNNLASSSSCPDFHHPGMAFPQASNPPLSPIVPEATQASATLSLSKPIPRRPPTNEGLLGDIVPGMGNQRS